MADSGLAASLDDLATRFRHFGTVECVPASPLYSRLALAIADDPLLLAIAAAAPQTQPVANLFLAAVQYLLIEDHADSLTRFYPTLGGAGGAGADPYPDFRAFSLAHIEEIRTLLRTRLVQTNAVGRCAALLPAFGVVARLAEAHPMALVEIGASAGLNLLWDRYAYDYGDGVLWGDPQSPLRLACAVRGDRPPPLPATAPTMASRLGIDLHPIDVHDPGQVRWLRALIWPEHVDRAERLQRAVEMARADPPRMLTGDALALLPEVLAALPSSVDACVFHSFTVNQFTPDARQRLQAILTEHAYTRHVYRVSLEGSPHALLRLGVCRGGAWERHHLALCEPHGRWIEWLSGM